MEFQSKKIEGFIVRDRVPPGDGPHPLILMLHGWTGNEQSMWVFAPHMPSHALLVAPRGLFPAPFGGYSWSDPSNGLQTHMSDFSTAIDSLLSLITSGHYPTADTNAFSLIGFSQGAALSYALALTVPERVRAVAGLAGFLPIGINPLHEQKPLSGKPLFVFHGAKDEIVPVSLARKSISWLKKAGAQVSYCEADVGHKLSSRCFGGLETFFTHMMK